MTTGEIIRGTRLVLGLSLYAFAQVVSQGLVKAIHHPQVIFWESQDIRDDRLFYRMYFLAHHADRPEIRQMAVAVLTTIHPEYAHEFADPTAIPISPPADEAPA